MRLHRWGGVTLEPMIINTSKISSRNDSRLLDILKEAHQNAREFFATVDISNAHPVATGYEGGVPKIIMVMPPVRMPEADPQVVVLAQDMLKAYGCDCVVFFYPVQFEPENQDAPFEHGVIVEVQSKGGISIKRLLKLKGKVKGKNELSAALPVLGKGYGLYYPNLIDEVV